MKNTSLKKYQHYFRITSGDINGFFTLFLDNVVSIAALVFILISFGFPKSVIYEQIVPAISLGVLIGDAIFFCMSIATCERLRRDDITAMPLGFDLPTAVGIGLTVIGPSFLVMKGQSGDVVSAATHAWYIGAAATLFMGGMKFVLAFFGNYIERLIPKVGLIGPLAGIGIVWLGANALLGTYSAAFVGLLSLSIVVYSLVCNFRLPINLPGAAAAIIFSTLIYYLVGQIDFFADFLGTPNSIPTIADYIGLNIAILQLDVIKALFGPMLNYIAIIIPFGILVTSIDINVTASANLAGDEYDSKQVLLTDAVATMIAGLFGACGQTTAYIGHSTYKSLGARSMYVLMTGVILGIAGLSGLIGYLIDLIPDPIIQPILIIIGFDMARLAFHYTPKRHVVAVAFAIVPAILNFCYVKLSELWYYSTLAIHQLSNGAAKLTESFPLHWLDSFVILGAMSNGYILTALIWGTIIAFMIDGKLRRAAFILFMSSVFSLFGIIHSVLPSASLYLPWSLKVMPEQGIFARSLALPYEIALGYLIASLVVFTLSLKQTEIFVKHHED